MSLEGAIRAAILAHVGELAAAVREEIARPRMVPVKEAIVSYRAILDAEKRGALTVYRIGNASLVDEGELYAWIKREGVKRVEREAEPDEQDEIDALVDLADKRRRQRGGGAA